MLFHILVRYFLSDEHAYSFRCLITLKRSYVHLIIPSARLTLLIHGRSEILFVRLWLVA